MFNSFIGLFRTMFGIILYRQLLSKFFPCYDTISPYIGVLMLLLSPNPNEMILVVFLLRTSTIELVLGLNVLLVRMLLLLLIFRIGGSNKAK